MRAMGPGSVSSLLKYALDVAYVLLFAASGLLVILSLASLILPIPADYLLTLDGPDGPVQVRPTGPLFAANLFGWAVYALILTIVIGRLRKIFATLTVGDPFHPENVRRLRVVGVALAAQEGVLILMRLINSWIVPGAVRRFSGWFDVTAWFAILVVFVLAEVFREGARLRHEAELTI